MVISSAAAELLTLSQCHGIGQATLLKFVRAATDEGLVSHAVSIRPELGGTPLDLARDKADSVARTCAEDDIKILAYSDPGYPDPLRHIPDPPALIYVRGNLSAIERQGFAVVGTRRASSSGLRMAQMIAGHLVKRGLSVVSGLALGIDAAAHQAALDAGGITVAVLAHGLDIVSPKSHALLAQQILRRKGALLSEHPPGTPPRPAEFVRRNRLQSGISVGSVVVESGSRGGAIHQASFTVRQRRTLFTVLRENPSDDLNQEGADQLVAEFGAIPVRTVAEFDEQLDRRAPISRFAEQMEPPTPAEFPVQSRFEL